MMATRRAASRMAGGDVAGEEPSLMWVVVGGNVGARRSAVILLHLRWKARPLVPTTEDGDADLWGRRRVESRMGGWSRGWEDAVVIMRNSVIFVVNCNSPTDSDHWKWIEFLVSIPWAAKQQASWNPIEFGLIPVNQTCSKRFVNSPRISGMDNIEPSPNGVILLVSNGAVVTLELNGS
jgi:hypothetical protein